MVILVHMLYFIWVQQSYEIKKLTCSIGGVKDVCMTINIHYKLSHKHSRKRSRSSFIIVLPEGISLSCPLEY